MIAFAAPITSPDLYRRCAEPGIERVAEADSENLSVTATGSICHSYNRVLDEAARLDGLEALVLLHHDTEIADAGFNAKARACLSDPSVGVVGCIGAVDVRSLAYWREGTVVWASSLAQVEEFGGANVPGFSWNSDGELPAHARTGPVDMVDGFLMVLSPWTVRNIRFDESLGPLHGYDFDFCFQVREEGRKVVAEDIKAIHHRELMYAIEDYEAWIDAYVRVAEKWAGHLGIPSGRGPEELRGEAEAAASQVRAAELEARAEAQAAQLAKAQSSSATFGA